MTYGMGSFRAPGASRSLAEVKSEQWEQALRLFDEPWQSWKDFGQV